MNRVRALFLAFLLWPITSACAQDWADLHGRFTFDGRLPTQKEIPVGEKDKATAGLPADFKLYDESLIIDEKTKSFANILVYAIPGPDKVKMPIHPDYEKEKDAEQIIRIKNFRFTPRITLMRAGQKLTIKNDDPFAYAPSLNLAPHEPTVVFGILPKESYTIKSSWHLPRQLSDGIYPYVKAYVLIRDNPYYAVTDANGEFTIKNLPVGKWTFQFWHERCGYITDVAQGVKQTKWPKGRVEVEIHHSGAELGEIAVSDKNLKN